MKLTVRLLRELYPDPESSKNWIRTDGYCVGGALCQGMGLGHCFPTAEELQGAICRANPSVDPVVASYAADEIITCSDSWAFEAAWSKLEEVL